MKRNCRPSENSICSIGCKSIFARNPNALYTDADSISRHSFGFGVLRTGTHDKNFKKKGLQKINHSKETCFIKY